MVIRLSERVCCDPDDPRDCAERAACEEVGESGHMFCGVCSVHLIPRHRCGCAFNREVDRLLREEKDRMNRE